MAHIPLDPDEKVLFLVRKHWFMFLLEVLVIILAALAPAVFYPSLFTQSSTLFFYTLWLLIMWITFFVRWTDYYLDVWIITDKKIIDAQLIRLFNRRVVSARLDRIQDVTVSIKGIFPMLLGYGNLHIQTAGDSEDIIIEYASRPEHIKEKILKVHNRAAEERLYRL